MAYKEKNTKKWTAQWFEENALGEKSKHRKRGFDTKKEALEYERQKKLSTSKSMDMKLSAFMDVYFEDKQNELKERTLRNKRYMMEQHIVPYFGKKKMSEITAAQVIQWQNEMQQKGFSDAYLRMIQNQLTSLFTHATKIYDLQNNPCKKEDGEGKNSRWQMFLVQKIVIPVLGYLALGMIIVALVTLPVMLVIALIYNSPFAIFFPPLESGDTVQSVTSAYVSEFHREVNELATNHEGYDIGRVVYVDYEGTNVSPSNYYDILSVYMIKHGVGDSATLINDATKEWIATVVDDMCDYTTSTGTETIQDADGNEVSQSVLYVNVILRDYSDMISIYRFNTNQVDLLETLMSTESLTMLGYSSGSELGQSSISMLEKEKILSGITDERQRKVCSFALSKVGYPYSQAYRDSGDYYDCSSLVFYAWKYADVNISYEGATTAAAEAQGLEEAGKTVAYEELQPGDLIFFSYCHNGRYRNISHVAIYMGSGKVVEAKNESAGVVYGDIPNPECIVTIGRP